MTLTEFMISAVVSGGLVITLFIFYLVRVEIYNHRGGLEMLIQFVWFAAILSVFILLAISTDDPGLYTCTLGAPREAQVEELTYMTGYWGRGRVRVDTDKGAYLLSSDALVPRSGEIYIIQRKKPWGAPRTFLCLSASEKRCWAQSDAGE